MKTLRIVAVACIALGILSIYNSCKKGPEDPWFSIHSRTGRVCADWNITVFDVDYADSLRRIVDSSLINGICGPEIDKVIDTYQYHWTFDKNGNFTSQLTIFMDTTYDIVNNTATCLDYLGHDSTITTTTLNWNFTSGVGDLKNKEQLYLVDNETQEIVVFNIIELREKEMKLETLRIQPDSNIVHLKQYTMEKIK